MKNTRNKIMAGIVCAIVVGAAGATLGDFEADAQKQVASNQKSSSETVQSQEDGTTTTPSAVLNQSEEQDLVRQDTAPKRPGGHKQGEGTTEVTTEVAVSEGQYKDGTYEGTADGYEKDLTVEVQITSGKIASVKVVSHNETPGFYEEAFQTVPSQIVQSQSTSVDTVSGATYSSVGIINAVNNALSKAKI